MVPLIVTGLGLIFVRQIHIESDYPTDLPGPISELGLSPLGDGRSFALYRIGAALLGVYFLTSAVLAFLAARRRAFVSHRAWMVRHVAAGVSVAAQRWYLGLRGATTAAGGRAAFYDGIFVATAVCLVTCELYLWSSSSLSSLSASSSSSSSSQATKTGTAAQKSKKNRSKKD